MRRLLCVLAIFGCDGTFESNEPRDLTDSSPTSNRDVVKVETTRDAPPDEVPRALFSSAKTTCTLGCDQESDGLASVDEGRRPYRGMLKDDLPIRRIMLHEAHDREVYRELVEEIGFNSPSIGQFGWLAGDAETLGFNEVAMTNRAKNRLGYVESMGGKATLRRATNPKYFDAEHYDTFPQIHHWNVDEDADQLGKRLPPTYLNDVWADHLIRASEHLFENLELSGGIRLFDEPGHRASFITAGVNNFGYSDGLRTLFIDYLETRYDLSDFSSITNSWDGLPLPTKENWDPTDRARRIVDYEFRLWKEKRFLDGMKRTSREVSKMTEGDVTLGIFSSFSLFNGYAAALPLADLWRVSDADVIEFDLYSRTHTGNVLAPEDRWLLEAQSQFIADTSGMPLLVTRNLKYSQYDDRYFRMLAYTTLLKSNNVIGINFYHYNIKIGATNVQAGVNHPRLNRELKTAFQNIEQHASVLERFEERNRILVIEEDPIHLGRDKVGTAKEKYFKNVKRLEHQTFGKITKLIGLDAILTTERALERQSLDDIDVVFVESEHMSQRIFDRLVRFADSGKKVVFANTPTMNRFSNAKPQRATIVLNHANLLPMPSDSDLATFLGQNVQSEWWITGGATNVDIDLEFEEGTNRRLLTLVNYNDEGSHEVRIWIAGTYDQASALFAEANVLAVDQGPHGVEVTLQIPALSGDAILLQ